jgi:cyclopropane fatty-acyl-phospholipid synthase-like methyltransferase
LGGVAKIFEGIAVPGRLLMTTWREGGALSCTRKLSAAIRAALPLLLRRRRTAAGVAGYFDLITSEARRFYGDSFHFGYFHVGDESLSEALDAHTDLVADLACVASGQRILDVGCGIAAPALRIAARSGCEVTAINISKEQVRQGRRLIERHGMLERVRITRGDARALAFPDESFDGIICLEAAGDICVAENDKRQLVRELHRLLRPGGRIGFSDLAMTEPPSDEEERALRALLYHAGAELVTDWPSLFESHGFTIIERRDILPQTMATWDRVQAVYEQRSSEAVRLYGRRIASRLCHQLEQIPQILSRRATFVILAAIKG